MVEREEDTVSTPSKDVYVDEDNAITTLVNHASIEVLLGMMHSLGSTYSGLGMHDKALEMK